MLSQIKDLKADRLLFHQQGFLSTPFILSTVSCIMENTVEGYLVSELQYVVGGIQLTHMGRWTLLLGLMKWEGLGEVEGREHDEFRQRRARMKIQR